MTRSRWRGAPVRWDDIVGHEPAKRELAVVAAQLRRHETAQALGLPLIKGILISGPSGSGKTLLAKALATAIDRPAYVVPTGEIDAQMLREVYEHLSGESCVVIWDEADLVMRDRTGGLAPDDGRITAAFCTALDGVDPITGPVTIALTAESRFLLDHAALRSGRLTTKIDLELPDIEERRALWELYLKGVPTEAPIDVERAAERSGGMTGADISATVMVALGLSMVDEHDAVSPAVMDEALLRRGHVVERERDVTDLARAATHEAGHAIFAALAFGVSAVASVTLWMEDASDGRTVLSDALAREIRLDRSQARSLVGLGYAGLVAEELEYGVGRVSVGCSADITKSTERLRKLISEWGAAEALGPLDLDMIENGGSSDRGSNEMRSVLWSTMQVESALILDQVRRLLAPRHGAIRALATALVAAPDQTLSGSALAAAIETALPSTDDGAWVRRAS